MVLLALLMLLLFAPICYSMEGSIGEEKSLKARVSWLFCLLRIIYDTENKGLTVKLGPCTLPAEKIAQKMMSKEDKPDEKPGFSNFKSLLTNLDINSIISLGIILLKKLYRVIRPSSFKLRGIVGFADPCTTGQLLGVYEAVAGACGIRKEVGIEGDFCQQRFNMELKMSGQFAIASLLIPSIWFITRKPIRSILKSHQRKGKSNE